jgi:hypothetical protein
LSIESENVWPSAMATFAVLHVEKDDQVSTDISYITITKLVKQLVKIIRKALFLFELLELFIGKIFVLLLGLFFNTPLFTF